jgi:uncharacterized membrane protein YphA (DoxX/SURF4 family)
MMDICGMFTPFPSLVLMVIGSAFSVIFHENKFLLKPFKRFFLLNIFYLFWDTKSQPDMIFWHNTLSDISKEV